MKNRDYTVLIRIVVIIAIGYFLLQSPTVKLYFGGKEKQEASDSQFDNKVEAQGIKDTLPEIIENPSLFKDDFIFLLEAYKEAWSNKNLSVGLYEEVKGKKNVVDGLNWLMEKREETIEIPVELSVAIRKYIDKYEGEAEKIADIFADKDLLSLVREYQGGEWIVNLKYLPPSNSSDRLKAEEKKQPEFKIIGVD